METDEADPIGPRHALFYLALAESAELELTNEAHSDWVAKLELEYPNLTTALAWCEAPSRLDTWFRRLRNLSPARSCQSMAERQCGDVPAA